MCFRTLAPCLLHPSSARSRCSCWRLKPGVGSVVCGKLSCSTTTWLSRSSQFRYVKSFQSCSANLTKPILSTTGNKLTQESFSSFTCLQLINPTLKPAHKRLSYTFIFHRALTALHLKLNKGSFSCPYFKHNHTTFKKLPHWWILMCHSRLVS